MRPIPPALQLGQGETVLVIDDASERLLAEEEVLAALGYEAVGFTGAAAALAACRASPARFDVLLVGYIAPAKSALDLAAALHEIAPNLPIVLATASADEISAETLLTAGISEVVHRPLISAEIAEALARCLPVKPNSVRTLQLLITETTP
jgi:CheY-like chemotaxis protein